MMKMSWRKKPLQGIQEKVLIYNFMLHYKYYYYKINNKKIKKVTFFFWLRGKKTDTAISPYQ